MIWQQQDRHVKVVLLTALLFLAAAVAASYSHAAAPGWRVLGAVAPTHLPPATSEVQQVAVDATGGTFTLTFQASTTAPLSSGAEAAEVEAALNLLASIGGVGGEVEVSGGPGNAGATSPYFVRFAGSLAATDQSQMTADQTQLTGGGAAATVTTVTAGGTAGKGTVAVYATNVGGAATDGSAITLSIGPLPAGIVTAGSSAGSGWTCPGGAGQSTVVCTMTAAVQQLQSAPPVKVPLAVAGTAPANASVQAVVEGGGAPPDLEGWNTYSVPLVVSADQASPGVAAFWAGAFDENGRPETRAGAHPYSAGTFFLLNTRLLPNPAAPPKPAGDVKDVIADLPPGFIGNPTVTKRCPESMVSPELGSILPDGTSTNPLCGNEMDIGFAGAITGEFGLPTSSNPNPAIGTHIYNDDPFRGHAATFTFPVVTAKVTAVASLRSDEDFGVSVLAANAPAVFRVFGASFILLGKPASAAGKAFLTNPSSCADQAANTPLTTVRVNAWDQPTVFDEMSVDIPPVVDCDELSFEPGFTFQPESDNAASVTAATAELSVDQARLLDPNQLAPPHLKTSVVTLPEGMVLNPSAANGLEACSAVQVGLRGTNFAAPNPIRFNLNPVTCPDASKIGAVEVVTPLLDAPLNGTVYLAAQGDNPFKSLLAMYLVVEDEETGITLKLPGKVTPDPVTGQLTAEFDNNPQTPFEELNLKFRGGGPRSTMATPDTCGEFTTKGTFTPWSAPESGPPAQTEDNFYIGKGVGGTLSCPATKAARAFDLGFEAGSTNPVAGKHSPFTVRITRPDGNQELDKISLQTPPGFTATLKGVAVCSDAQLAQALARNKPGDGAAELASPSCPASSQVGTTTIGAGVGSQPFYVKTGKVYRTGPYKGAKQSLTFVVPAVAGPFDLGVQVVRTALQVNPITAQITAESDPIPQILQGIPLQIRDVRVDIDRPGFALNPTNCNEMGVSAQVTGGSGASKSLSNRFQVDGCKELGFKPKLQLTYKGQTKRTGNPGLRAVLTQPQGQANISRTVVLLPLGSLIDNAHINNPCTRAQWAAEACPKSSILGTATAWSPLLDQPLSGNVYFRSNGGERELPDVVAALKGEVDVELVGFVDAVQNKKAGTSRVRNTFAVVPDAPVSKFELNLKGGKVGLIENSKNLCKQVNRATVKMSAHNGRALTANPAVKTSCPKKKKSKKKR